VETTVTFTVTGTATEGSDYAAIGTTVVFPAMSTAQTIAVAVTQDNIVETGGETVTVTLAGTNTAVTVGAGNAATVTIADNDASEVTIAATTQASEEGPADGLFTLTLSNPVSVETTVTFTVTGTATEGSDYAAIGTTVVFPAMSTAQTIAVAVTQDNIVETGGETVTVTLAGTNTAVTVGAGNAATVTIADNDASEVTIAATTQASEEGPADGLFTLTLSNPVSVETTVTFTVTGTATEGSDYAAIGTTVVFPAMSTAQTIAVAVTQDNIVETGGETVTVTLAGTNTAVTVGAGNAATVTIADNDASEVTIAATTQASEEGPADGLFTLTLSNPVSVETTVTFTVTGTATEGSDYAAIGTTVVFPAMSTAQTIAVAVTQDNIVETGGETVTVTLAGTNTAVTVGAGNAATVTIADNDASEVTIAATTQASEEGPADGLFTLTLSNPVSVETTVTFTVTGTATEGSDYAAIGTTVVFPAMSTAQTIAVAVTQDNIVETGGETVTVTLAGTNTAVTVGAGNAATVTIADNDASEVTIAATTQASEEGPADGLFTLTLSNPVSVETTVTFTVTGTATEGSDYAAIGTTVVFPAMSTAQTIAVAVTQDNIVETGGETVTVTLAGTNTAVTVGAGNAATVTIADNDASEVTIAATTQASEEGPADGLFTLTLSNPVSVETTVTFTVTGTATEGSDYAAIGTTVVFPAMSTAQTIAVAVTQDNIVETGGETVTVTLAGTNTAVTVGAGNAATVTIADNDASEVTIAATTQASEEGPADGLFTLTLSNPVSVETTVTFTVTGTATEGSDYAAIGTTVVFPAMSTAQTIAVAVTQDNIVETGGETVTVTLAGTNTAVTVGAGNAATVTIADNDASEVTIAATTQASEEGPADGLFTLTLSNPVSVETTVTFTVTGTATEGSDYAAIGTTVVFPAMSTAQTIAVAVTQDNIVETGGETVTVTLAGTNTAVTVGAGNAATVTIADNDASEVTIAATTQASEEGPADGLFTLTLSNPVSVETTVTFTVTGTATEGSDYAAIGTTVVFPAMSTAQTIAVAVTQDNIVETGGETVTVTLAGTNTAVTVGAGNAATVTIADNDASEVTIAATTQASEEGPADGLFTLTLSNPVSVETTVTFTVTGTATEGSDYAAIGTTVVFPAMSTAQTIAVAVTQDNIVETGGETVTVTLAGTNTAVTVGAGNAATVTIADNDASEVTIAATTQASEEGPADGLFTLTLSNPVSVETTVTFTVTGTATEGSDYAAIGTTVVFPAMSTAQTIAVAVTQDNIVETGGETVTVTLAGTNTAVTVGAGNAATVTIADNDASEVTIAATTQASEEGPADGLFTLTLSNPVSVETTVTFTVTGTATEGSDYAAIGTTVVFPAMSTAQTIAVAVTQDNIVETGGETVTVTLAGTNTAVTVGAGNAATVTIADNDASEVTIAATTQASEEGPADGLFTLTLSNPVSVETTVTFTVTGTATEGSDYAAIGTTVVFPAMSTAQTIAVAVTQDNIVETGGETVTVTLAGTNTAVTVGAGNAATVTIADNDASEVTIAATTQASEEGPADGLFTLTLSNPVSVETTVTFTVTGTATEGSDYAAIGTTVVFPAMSTAQTIAVAVTQDNIVETGGETVTVTLAGTNTAVTVGAGNAATVTIADNDHDAVYTVEPAQNVDSYVNGETLATVTDADGAINSAIVISGSLPAGVSINSTTGEITVDNTSLLISGTYSFDVTTVDADGGVTTQTVTVTIGADTEAVYTVEPAQNVDSYINGETLATVTDADGAINSAIVISGSLPAGVSINSTTGEITVDNATLLVANTYTFDVTTVDAVGGVTTQTVTVTIGADTEAVYTVEPAQNVDSYINGETLATVTDADGAINSAIVISGSLPAGVSINSTTGEITVDNATLLVANTYTFDVTTVDAVGGVTTQTVTITIGADTEATYAVQSAQNVDSYVNGETLATVTDADGAITSAVLASGTTLPAGMALNAATGEVTVSNATLLAANTYTFDVTTVDSDGGVTTQTVTVTIGADTEAVYTVEPAQNVDSYVNGETLATVTDADGAITSAVLANGTTLPAGMALNAVTGEVTVSDATLLVANTYTFDVTTVDSDGGVTTQTVTVTIGADTEAVYTVEPAQNVDSYVNGETLATVTDADGAINSAIVISGSLPAGVSINSTTGKITVDNATLLVANTYTFDVTTVDSDGGVTTQTVTVTIGADTEAVYTVEPAQNVDSYVNGETLATVTDADGAITSAVLANATTLPAGMALNAATGEVTVSDATLLAAKTYSFDVTTVDADGGVTTQTVTVTIGADTEAVYSTPPVQEDELQDDEVIFSVIDLDGAIVSAELVNGYKLPNGLVLNPLNGEIIVEDRTKIKPGTYYLEIITYDEFSGLTLHKLEIVINKKLQLLEIICSPDVQNNNDLGQCYAKIDVSAPVVFGGTNVSVEGKRSDGLNINDLYPTGTTIITWTATDQNSNSVQCDQKVTVIDNETPVVEAPSDILYSGYFDINSNIFVELSVDDAIFSDNCSSNLTWEMTGVITDNGAGQIGNYQFPLGETTVIYKNTDITGLVATDTMKVIAIKDEKLLVFTNNQLAGNIFDNLMFEQITEDMIVDDDQIIGPYNGTFTIQENGDFLYIPNKGFFGDDKIAMVVCYKSKGLLVCANYLLSIRVLDNINVFAGSDTTICEGSVLELVNATSTDNAIWTTNGDGLFDDIYKLHPIYTPGNSDIQTGEVILTITSMNCAECENSKDSLILSVSRKSVVNAGPDIYSCPGEKVQITSTNAAFFNSIKWSTNGKGVLLGEFTLTPTYVPNGIEEGIIEMILTVSGTGYCKETLSSDTLLINYGEKITLDAGDPIVIFNETSTILNAEVYPENSEYIYTWSPGTHVLNANSKSTETIDLASDTEFKVTVTDLLTGCIVADSVLVAVEKSVENLINIRNGISPNGDGKNDIWLIEGIELFPDNEAIIFNRWGDEIIKIKNYDNETNSWDGRNRHNNVVPDGTYFYVLKLNNIQTFTGWIQVRNDNR
jgi:gliding motility-associated-like protein